MKRLEADFYEYQSERKTMNAMNITYFPETSRILFVTKLIHTVSSKSN